MYDQFKCMIVEQKGSILYVTINNPPMNEVTDDVDHSITNIWPIIAADRSVNAVVLSAAGDRVFCAGGSLDEMIERRKVHSNSEWVHGINNGRRMLMNLLDCDTPIIVRLQGHAIGLGATIALYSDIVIAADDVNIADPHVQIGLTAGDGGALMWHHLIGHSRAKYYLLTGDRIKAPQAAEMGLIHAAVPRAELDEAVDKVAQKIAGLPRAAVRTTKRASNISIFRDVVQYGDAHFGLESQSRMSEDFLEAITAMKEKRAPKLTGN